MKPVTRRALTLGLLLLGVWFYEVMRPVPQPPGILAPNPPLIVPVEGKPAIFERNEHVLTAVARFRVQARVLALERYKHDRESKLAPLDMTLGWGQMSDSVTLKYVDLAQTDRRVLFKSYDPKLPDESVEASMLNVHVIAADAKVEEVLSELRPGNIVQIEGWLVEAVTGDGWRWRGEARTVPPMFPGTLLWLQKIEAS